MLFLSPKGHLSVLQGKFAPCEANEAIRVTSVTSVLLYHCMVCMSVCLYVFVYVDMLVDMWFVVCGLCCVRSVTSATDKSKSK